MAGFFRDVHEKSARSFWKKFLGIIDNTAEENV
jgi:hypothetical protein